MRMAKSLALELIGEKTLHQAAEPKLVAYCPSMDLIALGTTDQQVLIYRLNGQRVYGATQKNEALHVQNIKWKPNGQLLAIAWSDGTVRLVGAESGKIVHQFSTGDQVSGVTCMAWASNLTGRKPNSSRSKTTGPDTWEDLFVSDAGLSVDKAPPDLPRDLSLIDIEPSLPKLSVLAAAGSSEDVFCSRTSLDALFRPFDPKDNDVVDIMVVGTKEGAIHLSIYDSFVIGSFPSPEVSRGVPSYVVLHASHELYSTHALLVKGVGSQENIYFVPMDLRFVSSSSKNLSVLASRSTALQTLLRYIHQVQILMVTEWKSTQELPNRFLRNINDTLGEQGNRNIVQALYHSVATGHTFPVVREWLVDELSERGHKRWDKAVITGLENLRRLVHENMLPALDRCSVILSRLSGIARFQGNDDSTGFSSQQISLIQDTVACLHLVASKILIQVVDELDLFASFSSWLRYEIDRLASDSSGASNDDPAEKEALIDHGKVLLYLQTAMTHSPLATFLGDASAEDYQNDWLHAEQGLPMFNLLDKQLQKQEQGLPYMKALPRVELLCKYLARQATIVFGQIAEAEKRNVLFGEPLDLGSAQSGAPIDMKISKVENSSCYIYVSFVPQGHKNRVQITQVGLSIESGISSVSSLCSSAIQLGDGEVKDIKFLDSTTLLVSWEMNSKARILNICFGTSSRTESCLEYSPQKPGESVQAIRLSNENVIDQFSEPVSLADLFAPNKVYVRKRNRHQRTTDDTRRLVMLGKDKLHYKVFKLSNGFRAKGQRDEDISML